MRRTSDGSREFRLKLARKLHSNKMYRDWYRVQVVRVRLAIASVSRCKPIMRTT